MLGPVHGGVGLTKEFSGVRGRRRRDRNPDTERRPDRVAVQGERAGHGLEQPTGDDQGLLATAHRAEHRELVTAEPGHQVLGAEHAPDPEGHRLEQPVLWAPRTSSGQFKPVGAENPIRPGHAASRYS